MELDTWILIVVVSFMLGYWFGYRHGREEGYRLGTLFAPIEIRRRTLEEGRCVVCGTGARGTESVERSQGDPRSGRESEGS